jgi:replication factor A2
MCTTDAFQGFGFTPQQQMVATMIGAATSDTGCGIGDLESSLRAYGVTSSDISDACDFLSAEGHIYPTIDDDHFHLCTG